MILGLFQPVHSEVLPRRAWSLQTSFTNPHDRLLCRVILCRALSPENKTLPEDRSPETGLELVPNCCTQARTRFCMKIFLLEDSEFLCVQYHLPKRFGISSTTSPVSDACRVGASIQSMCSTVANSSRIARGGVWRCVCLPYSSRAGSW